MLDGLRATTFGAEARIDGDSGWIARPRRPADGAARPAGSLASVVLGAAVIWLFSRDGVFIANWAWETSVPSLPVMALAAAWVVIVVGGVGPLLSVAAVRDRAVATGVMCGWWAFLAVPWTEALASRSQIGTIRNPTPSAFWVGTAVAALGGLALVAWIRAPRAEASMVTPETALHAWRIPEREYERHEARRGRRFAYERIDPRRTALVVVDMVRFFVDGQGIIPTITRRLKVSGQPTEPSPGRSEARTPWGLADT